MFATTEANVSTDPIVKATWLKNLNHRLELHAEAQRGLPSSSSETFAGVTVHEQVPLAGAFGRGMNAEAACTSRVYECVLPITYFFDSDEIDDGSPFVTLSRP